MASVTVWNAKGEQVMVTSADEFERIFEGIDDARFALIDALDSPDDHVSKEADRMLARLVERNNANVMQMKDFNAQIETEERQRRKNLAAKLRAERRG